MKGLYFFSAAALLMLSRTGAQAQCNLPVSIVDSTWRCDSTISYIALAQGTAPYTYLWNTGQTAGTIWNVPRGVTYSVTVTDAQGCTGVASMFAIPSGGGPTVTGVVTRQGCSGNGLGAAVDVTVTGGVAPYTYFWSNGETVEDAQNLPGNSYLQVEDAAGCYAYYSPGVTGVNVYQPYTVAASCNQNNGVASIYAQGNYAYLWSNGATTSQISGLAAGWYGVTISQSGTACTYTTDMQVGYDPNCETVISGTVFNATSTGTCVSGLPVMYSGWVELRGTNPNGGYYYAYVVNGNYTIRTRVPDTYTLSYYSYYGNTNLGVLCPNVGSHSVIVTSAGGTQSGNDFYVQYPHNLDVAADVYVGGAAPGFGHWEYARICNNGGSLVSGVASYDYDAILGAPISMYVHSQAWNGGGVSGNSMSVASQSGNTITFNYTIQAGTCVAANISFVLPTTVALGTVLTSHLLTNQSGDTNASNNIDTASTVVVGSFDPNDKRMMRHRTGDDYEGGIYVDDNQMEYIVRFQNTGTAAARRVVIRDTLESNLRPETVTAMAMSHNGVARIENGNILVVEFNNIYLPDSATDFEGSQGYVKFEIMRQAGLALGTSIENSAAIYFDFNAPVITNTAVSTLEEIAQSVENQQNAMQVMVMPNPFNEQIAVQYELQSDAKVSVRLYNALGQVAAELAPAQQAAGVQRAQISTANLASGIYWLQIESSTGKYVQKVIKQ